jgi:uncharacterized protein
MSDVTITVRGAHEERLPAEEGTVRLTVRIEHADRTAALEQLGTAAAGVRAGLARREDADALSSWTSSRAHIWTDRPWGPEGTRLAPLHHATQEFSAVFSAPIPLAEWLDETAAHEAVQVDGVSWRLSEATAAAARDRVATAAVRDAAARARSYAAALGYENVTPVAVADAGLLGGGGDDGGSPKMLRAAAMADGGMSFQPDDVTVAVTVEARFSAR